MENENIEFDNMQAEAQTEADIMPMAIEAQNYYVDFDHLQKYHEKLKGIIPRPTYYKLQGDVMTDMGSGVSYALALSNLTPQAPVPVVGDTVFFKTDSATYVGTVTEVQAAAVLVLAKLQIESSGASKPDLGYDLVIRTQADFDAWCAELDAGTFAGESVLIVGGGGSGSSGEYVRSDGKGLHLPSTLKQLHGLKTAKIDITNNTDDNGIWYDSTPTGTEYSIKNISVSFTGGERESLYIAYSANAFNRCTNLYNCAGTVANEYGNSYGFSDCTNLINCAGDATGSINISGSGYGFYNCTNLTNCIGNGTGAKTGVAVGYGFHSCTSLTNCVGNGTGKSGYSFYDCKVCSNCRQNPDVASKTATWGGTNTNINKDTCPEYTE